jgi:hypothetical protein
MAPKSKSASQLTRRIISVPSWVWSLVLLAAAGAALTAYQFTRVASAANPQSRMDQAQESISHYSAAPAPARDPNAESVTAYLAAHGVILLGPDVVRDPYAQNDNARQSAREEKGVPAFNTRLTERERQLLDQHNQ